MRIIIIGAGEVGSYIAWRLAAENKEVVVVDRDPNVLAGIAEKLDVETVQGPGSSPRILEEAGVKRADLLLAVTDSDEINLIACTFTNILAPNLIKVARIRNPEYTEYQEVLARDLLHIDIVINPEQEVIASIERLMSAPGAAEISEFTDVQVNLAGIWIHEGNRLVGLDLAQVKQKLGVANFIVAAIFRGDKAIIPSGENVIKAGDLVYFVCAKKDLPQVLQAFGSKSMQQHDVMIIGGGNIGFRLAKQLERKKGLQVKLLERDRERCEFLAQNLERSIVLYGDGTDQDLLQQENVSEMDVVITLTGDEENNILCSLLAKSMGSKMTITRIDKNAYLPLMQTIGLEHTVSPRLSAANSILRYVRHGTVISSISIQDKAEALEVSVGSDSLLANKTLKDLPFPKGAIVLCIISSQEVVIPTGESVIKSGDKLVILSTRKQISQVEAKLLSPPGQKKA
ncbi:MAG: Trk system potassium transporter TrkA [Thermodesulfobacteriota bacterium]